MKFIIHRDTRQQGFTLIELLVVVAIISLLSAVVMTALNDARSRGADSAIVSNLINIRTQAEVLYSIDGNYDKVCGVPGEVAQDSTVIEAIAATDNTNGDGIVTCGSTEATDNQQWAVAADLPGGGAFCIDSTGHASNITKDGQDYYLPSQGDAPHALNEELDPECN